MSKSTKSDIRKKAAMRNTGRPIRKFTMEMSAAGHAALAISHTPPRTIPSHVAGLYLRATM